MSKNGFSKLEMLVVIVVGLVVVLGGILLSMKLSINANVKTFKEDADAIAGSAKNAYVTFVKEEKNDYILNGEYNSMCITIKGLIKNGLLVDDYEKYEGFVVVEFKDNKYITSLWINDKKLMVEGFEVNKIKDLSYKKGVNEYISSAKMSASSAYNSASKENGGTGTNYSGTCINEKV